MSILNHIQKYFSRLSKKREAFYSIIVQELKKGEVDEDLMSKAFVKADGDEKKAKARYIRMRADVLFHQEQYEKAEEAVRNEAARLAKMKVEYENACLRAEQEQQRQAQKHREQTEEYLRRHLLPNERLCPNCLAKYRPGDYLKDNPEWHCSSCKQALPKE